MDAVCRMPVLGSRGSTCDASLSFFVWSCQDSGWGKYWQDWVGGYCHRGAFLLKLFFICRIGPRGPDGFGSITISFHINACEVAKCATPKTTKEFRKTFYWLASPLNEMQPCRSVLRSERKARCESLAKPLQFAAAKACGNRSKASFGELLRWNDSGSDATWTTRGLFGERPCCLLVFICNMITVRTF